MYSDMFSRNSTVQDTQDALEALIDKSSLSSVIEALTAVCHGKADHLSSNWQDRGAAQEWTQAAQVLEQANQSIDV